MEYGEGLNFVGSYYYSRNYRPRDFHLGIKKISYILKKDLVHELKSVLAHGNLTDNSRESVVPSLL